MKVGGGKAKGSAYERLICKRLSLWVSGGKREDVFWRSAMSGGRATVKGKTVRQAGDITAVAPEGHPLTDVFYIECKHVKKLDLESFLFKNKGLLAGFWKDAVKQADRHDKEAVIIARQNGWPDLVLCEGGFTRDIIGEAPGVSREYYIGRIQGWEVTIYWLADLLKSNCRWAQ
jgi:hypothetical protein